jgi:probable phosphomutase (TIGR03848 family)
MTIPRNILRRRALYPSPTVPLLLLVRHAVTPTTGTVLYGRADGVSLSDRGRSQAQEVAERLAVLPIAAVYSSPLERCRETARPIAEQAGLRVRTAPGLVEVDAGRWTGRRLSALRRTRAWQTVVGKPAEFRFPDGESFVEMQRRTMAALERIARAHPEGIAVAVSHGDNIRLAMSWFAGAPLDRFQRIVVAPASVSAVWLPKGPDGQPAVVLVNDSGSLADLAPRRNLGK